MYPNNMYPQIDYRYLSNVRSQEEVLQALQNCEAICEYTEGALVQTKDLQGRRKQLKLLHDCSDICTLTAKYVARHSEYGKSLALLCLQVCQDCGVHCLHEQSDSLSKRCGQICLDCSIVLRKYTGTES